MKADYTRIRPDVIKSLKAYVETRRPTGGFLQAVLSNNLMEAVSRADKDNVGRLFDIVSYVYNELPSECWGSPKRYWSWLDGKPAICGWCGAPRREEEMHSPVSRVSCHVTVAP